MSPSPQDKLLPGTVRNYSDSWRAIMQLVRSGYSWSGRERNCVFLNCTPARETEATGETQAIAPRFADASAISGLDFPDDGRSVAVVDWDHDGDLDLWLRNRTAPRLRLMRNLTNDIAPDDQHISLRLIGTTCNRDAIGARAELVLNTTGPRGKRPARQRLVRSVRAGDAFLSQSSKWLHFGVKRDASAEQVIVDWPGGERERFPGVSVGGRYEIKQGAGQAIRLKQRERVSLVAEPYEPMSPTAAARIVLPGKVAMPPLALQFDDKPDSLQYENIETPTLITFWTSSCPNCRRELTDVAKHRSKFEQANLSVVAVCLDGLDQPNSANMEHASDANTFLDDIAFPFPSARTTQETMELIRHFQNVLFGKYPGFVVPQSFMVDAQGQVVSIYRGSFSHETYLQDRALVDLDDKTLRTLTTPLVGTWITEPATRSQFAEFVGTRLLANEPKAALRYYEAAIQTEKDTDRRSFLKEQAKQLSQFIQRKERD